MTDSTAPAPPAGLTPPAGPDITVRPVRPSDAARLARFYADLSPEARHRRFMATRAGITTAEARAWTRVDHCHREGFVAVAAGAGRTRPIVGHLCLEPHGDRCAEFAIVVADAVQHQHIGSALLAAGLAWARANGLVDLEAVTEPDNLAMLHLAQASDTWTTVGPVAGGTVPLTLPT
ncbi:MAG TPA: GNAT family N-acetyltransferase [Candidatus Sulfotelmatobacter sp.]|nr:GNAT family N-acetyltransferase [Candidatus Sulfotelmatobacter sp.]